MSTKTLQLERDLIDAGVRERALETELEAVKAALVHMTAQRDTYKHDAEEGLAHESFLRAAARNAQEELTAVKAERDELGNELIDSVYDCSAALDARDAAYDEGRRKALQEAAKVAAEAYWSGVSITEAIQALIDGE